LLLVAPTDHTDDDAEPDDPPKEERDCSESDVVMEKGDDMTDGNEPRTDAEDADDKGMGDRSPPAAVFMSDSIDMDRPLRRRPPPEPIGIVYVGDEPRRCEEAASDSGGANS